MEQRNKINVDTPLEFKLTRPLQCPYLNALTEQRLATDIALRPEAHDTLARAGFRRVENWAYKPVCSECSACIPIRIASGDGTNGEIKLSRSQRRILKINNDLQRTILPNFSNQEHFDIFKRYLNSRHADGQMTDMDFSNYTAMVTASPIQTKLLEYRLQNKIVAIIMIDIQDDGISAVYSFFEPELSNRSIGTYMILDCAALAYTMKRDYVYLGYFVKQSDKMKYKEKFSPAQYLVKGQWVSTQPT